MMSFPTQSGTTHSLRGAPCWEKAGRQVDVSDGSFAVVLDCPVTMVARLPDVVIVVVAVLFLAVGPVVVVLVFVLAVLAIVLSVRGCFGDRVSGETTRASYGAPNSLPQCVGKPCASLWVFSVHFKHESRFGYFLYTSSEHAVQGCFRRAGVQVDDWAAFAGLFRGN